MGSLGSVGTGVLVGWAGWLALWAAAVVLVGVAVSGSPGKLMFADSPTVTLEGESRARKRTFPLVGYGKSVNVTSVHSLSAAYVCGDPAVTIARC